MSPDPLRPRWHFTGEPWMNDPMFVSRRGELHLFYQHNPGAARWGDMHWGHAVSRDLLRWERRPIALAPGAPWDRAGVFTGCVVPRPGGGWRAFYTGVRWLDPLGSGQSQCAADSEDLETWHKLPDNPLIAAPPPGFGETWRDPVVWAAGGGWHMLVGSELSGGGSAGGAALLYSSADQLRWDYRGVLCADPGGASGRDFECPDLFPLGGQHLLLSSRGHTWAHLGRLEGERFVRRALVAVDRGAFYAGRSALYGGRRLLLGWIPETRPESAQLAAGWSGVLSLPRELSIGPDGGLRQAPARELAALRGAPVSGLAAGRLDLGALPGDSLELDLRFPPQVRRGGVSLLGGAAVLSFDRDARRFAGEDLALDPDAPLALRVFVDRSVVEVFAAQRICRTLRAYPADPGERSVALLGGGAPIAVTAWPLGIP